MDHALYIYHILYFEVMEHAMPTEPVSLLSTRIALCLVEH